VTTDTITIDAFYRSTSGKLYAGSAGKDGKFTGAQVRHGRISGPVRTGVNGTVVANIVGDPIEHYGADALPFDRYVTPEGNPAGQIAMNQFLEAMTAAQAAASKADEKPGE
jgi:hypothetical protein